MRFRRDVLQTSSLVVLLLGLTVLSGPVSAQVVTGELGAPGATTTIDGKQIPPPAGNVWRGDQGEGIGIETVVGAARGAAEGRAQRLAHHDRRCRLRCAGDVRRRHSDPCPRPHRRTGTALHQLPFHRAMLADARGDHHGPQPSFGGHRRGRRNSDGLSGLRLHHPDRQRHRRHHPQGERLRHLVVRQEPQHAVLPVESGRAVRTMAQRHGLRIFLRLRRRRRQPVAAEPVS